MASMADLSPAAQAVIAASNCAGSRVVQLHIAAALRAAADQVVPDEDAMPINLAYRVRWDALQSVRFQLLAIATELEGQ